jgi:hypothetical protein
MKRTHMVLATAVAFLSVLVTQQSVSAAVLQPPTIEMTMVTLNEDGSTASQYTAPCPVYEVSISNDYAGSSDGRVIFKIGYSSEDQGYTWETPEGKVTLTGTLDPDPMITFGGPVIDFGAPSNFSFNFILPLSPQVSNPSLVSDSFSGSVTNGAGPGVTVTALPPPAAIPVDADGITEIEVYTLSDNNMASWKNVGLDLMPTTVVSPLAVGASASTPAFNAGPIATIPVAGVGAWTHMRADVNFRLSGGGDIFTFNGAKILVPEPGSFVLALLSLGAFGMFRRRSRS